MRGILGYLSIIEERKKGGGVDSAKSRGKVVEIASTQMTQESQ